MFGWFKQKTFQSPNYGERKDGLRPHLIVLHYTGMETAAAALERLCDPASQVSAHYVVEENGKIHALVPEDKRAWHAGASFWRGLSDINSASIGIEIVNPGHEFGYRAFPKAQVAAVTRLCREIMERHDIGSGNVLGHSDIAPARKEDPGELFPWEQLARQGIGIWPQPREMDYQAAEDLICDRQGFIELLHGFGYDPEAPEGALITAFHRHFYPKVFEAGGKPDQPDIASIARLLALIRQRHEIEGA